MVLYIGIGLGVQLATGKWRTGNDDTGIDRSRGLVLTITVRSVQCSFNSLNTLCSCGSAKKLRKQHYDVTITYQLPRQTS